MSKRPRGDDAVADALSDRWLTAEEAGQYTGFSSWSIRRFAASGLVKHAKSPGRRGSYRFKRQWLDDFLEARAVEPKLRPLPKPTLAPATDPLARVRAVKAESSRWRRQRR